MNLKIVIFLLSIVTLISCQDLSNGKDFLVKVYKGTHDEVGVESGYINLQGDTVIALGKYRYCYTDTLKSFAIVLEKNGTLIGIDKNDKKLFEVLWYDNGPDYLSDGLFRIKKNEKIGYSNANGQVIIKPQFDCAYPFENGRAKVSYNCKAVQNGEHTQWESDGWFYIDKTGRKLNKNAL